MRLLSLALLLAAACSTDAPGAGPGDDDGPGVGDVDGAAVDARRQAGTVDGECVVTHEATTTFSSGSSQTIRWYNVEVDADPGQRVWALACDAAGSYAGAPECPAGATCTGDPLPYYSGCQVLLGGQQIDGVRRLQCGYEVWSTPSGGQPGAPEGYSWTSITVHVE